MTRFNISLNDELIRQLDEERGQVKRATAIAAGLKYLLGNKGFVRSLVGNTDEKLQAQA